MSTQKAQKTIESWFNEQPDGELKTSLLKNMDVNFKDTVTESLEEAINKGFYWFSTDEGFPYWDNLTSNKFTPTKDEIIQLGMTFDAQLRRVNGNEMEVTESNVQSD